jgi:two-component system phosphate regulon sensor histidine kinase PhoR
MRSTRKIGLLLALVFLLPALFFSVYEISSLNNDEKMIQEIYTKQLEAILFSVNQYSDDILNNWIFKIENGLDETAQKDTISAELNKLLNYNSSLYSVFICDSIDGKPILKYLSTQDSTPNLLRTKIEMALPKDTELIQQLISYKKNGFQKIVRLTYAWEESEDLQCLIFITENKLKAFRIVGFMVDPELFVQDLVGPRLQVIARDQFILSVFDKSQMAPIYSTLALDSLTASDALTKDFWQFPDYQLGIRTQGSSLQKLIDERTTTNLLLLISLDIILIIAVILVFRNVKKEVQLAQNKADFVSNVSHEIRTPLALISMFAETLEMGRVKSEEKKQEYYGIISKETHRLSGIVNKILNFSQTEANKKVLNIESISLSKSIHEVLTNYDFHLKNKGFEYSFDQTDELNVKADKEAFVEIIINLIDNAIKYSGDKKRIEISIGKENSYGFVAVKDHGIGISAMDQKHIFDKFYRVSTGDLAKSKGTGLGLSLVKQLVEAQQGKITVSSNPGHGSLFTLYFPLVTN